MRAVVQQVRSCSVHVDGRQTGSIDTGLLVYLGVGKNDSTKELTALCDKIVNLRIFTDGQGKMNLSVLETRGGILSSLSSRFLATRVTADALRTPKLRAPEMARELYEKALVQLALSGLRIEHGEFQASMEVSYTNMGFR